MSTDKHVTGELIGSVLAGKYRVERVIGSGGMGHVVEATHLELDELVALKFLNADGMNDPETLARFRREAKLAAKIKSEHVAKVTDVGRLESGAPFIVMELLRGRDLSQVLRERRCLPVSEAVDYLLQAMEAIAEAHAIGIVHRDLKPQNLFLTTRKDGSVCVKVLDFGISKLMPSSETVETEGSLTSTTSTLGSPLYMSPEQMTNPKAVDARADIWALGATFYRLVAGKPPFNGESVAQVCGMILIGVTPPKVSTFVSSSPPIVDEIILKCLQKNPDDRFANIGDLAVALAPLGTAAATTSAERVLRVLQSAGFAPNEAVPRPVPSGPTSSSQPASGAAWSAASSSWPSVGAPSTPPGAASSSPSVSGSQNAAISASGQAARSASHNEVPGDRTNPVWEHPAQAPSSGKKRAILLALGAVAMLGIGALAMSLVGGSSSVHTAAPGPPTEVTAPAPPAATTAAPVVVPSSASTASPTSTAAAPSATATVQSSGGKAPSKGPGPAKGTPKKGDELFDDRF